MSRAPEIYPLEQLLKREQYLIGKDKHNSAVLSRYFKVRSTQVAPATLQFMSCKLRMLSQMLNKKFERATIEDIEDLHYEMCQRWKNPNTRNKHRKLLKKFYQWVDGYSDEEYPPRVKWIKTEKVPLVAITTDDLISYDDALKICESASNLRDRALFSCLLDAGCRIGEILPVRIGESKITETGAVLDSEGKTGRQPVILTWSTSILSQWLNNHPFRDDVNAPLFPDLTKARPTVLSYSGARKTFKACVERSGVKKRVWLHLFKHISSTEDALNGMPDSFRRYKHHWTQSSKMPAVYEHLSQSLIPKIQQETWKRIGIDVKPNGREVEQPKVELVRICRRCKYENPRSSTYCNRCGFSLNPIEEEKNAMARTRADELLNKLTQNPEKLEKLLALIDAS